MSGHTSKTICFIRTLAFDLYLARKPHRLYFLTTHAYAAGSLRSPVSLYFVSAG